MAAWVHDDEDCVPPRVRVALNDSTDDIDSLLMNAMAQASLVEGGSGMADADATVTQPESAVLPSSPANVTPAIASDGAPPFMDSANPSPAPSSLPATSPVRWSVFWQSRKRILTGV